MFCSDQHWEWIKMSNSRRVTSETNCVRPTSFSLSLSLAKASWWIPDENLTWRLIWISINFVIELRPKQAEKMKNFSTTDFESFDLNFHKKSFSIPLKGKSYSIFHMHNNFYRGRECLVLQSQASPVWLLKWERVEIEIRKSHRDDDDDIVLWGWKIVLSIIIDFPVTATRERSCISQFSQLIRLLSLSGRHAAGFHFSSAKTLAQKKKKIRQFVCFAMCIPFPIRKRHEIFFRSCLYSSLFFFFFRSRVKQMCECAAEKNGEKFRTKTRRVDIYRPHNTCSTSSTDSIWAGVRRRFFGLVSFSCDYLHTWHHRHHRSFACRFAMYIYGWGTVWWAINN